MAWSITDVARMSGVTSRTLRHYDEIGLLVPAHIGSNGHRYYEEAGLLRLQQLLLLRELGLGLREIAAVLESQVDQVAALREHHRRLLAERRRLDVLAATVGRTIAELEEDKDTRDMAKINRPENLFEGFDATRHEATAREQWPDEAEQSRQLAGTLTDEDQARLQREATAAMVRVAELAASGTPATGPAVQAEVDAPTGASAGCGPRTRPRSKPSGRRMSTIRSGARPTTRSPTASPPTSGTRWPPTRTPA